MADGEPYDVGYGKPPKEHRFAPGHSGNPAGRKKGSRGIKTDLHAELSSALTISINKQPVSGTKQRLMMKSLTTRAAAGDVRASALLLPLIMQIFGIEDRGEGRRQLSQQDQAILEDLLAGGGEQDRLLSSDTDLTEAGEATELPQADPNNVDTD